MKKMHKYFSVLVVIAAALSVLPGCSSQNPDQAGNGDSLFLQNAYAQGDSAQRQAQNMQLNQSRHNAITRAAAMAGPAVVGINVVQVKRYVQRSPFHTDDPFWKNLFPEYFRDRIYEQPVESLGSGFIISSDGYIVTNEHVVENAEKIVITLPGGERHNAKMIGTDRVSDIALLKIDGKDFPYLQFGNSDDLIVGEWVIALGNPFGLFELNDQPTVTVGVISAVNRDWGRSQETNRVYMDMIQTDAAINHGNSGGPLVNSLGKVIGMNTLIYTGSRYQQGFVGIGFAIPVSRIRKIVDEIKRTGGVNRDYWLGFKVQDLNPIMVRALGIDVKEGVIITQVDPGSSAEQSGLRPEDIILAVGGKPVKNTNSLLNTLGNMDLKVGDELSFTILRDKQKKEIRVKLIEKK